MTDVVNFDEEKLTTRDHMDPDKHWIGESLPSPSLGEVTFAGVETSTGESTFPARADHSHDARARFCGMTNTTGIVIPAGGSAYISGLTVPWGSENFLHSGSTQLIDFPQEGVYELPLAYQIVRSSGTFPAGIAYDIRYDFNNVTSSVTVKQTLVPPGLTQVIDHTRWWVYAGSVGPTTNLQILVINRDSVNWTFYPRFLEMFRRHSSLGAQS